MTKSQITAPVAVTNLKKFTAALKESDLSKQRGGYIVAVSPENPEKERRKKKAKNKFFNRVLRGLAASLVPCICF